MPMGVNQGSIDSVVHGHYIIAFGAEVVEWQTRTFEGRVGKPVRVQIPPSAPNQASSCQTELARPGASIKCDGIPNTSSDPLRSCLTGLPRSTPSLRASSSRSGL